jgi:hypothetical protein
MKRSAATVAKWHDNDRYFINLKAKTNDSAGIETVQSENPVNMSPGSRDAAAE